MNVQAPRSPAGGPAGPGLLLGHNMPPTDLAATRTLPDPVPNWPELGDTVKGFRPGEACDIAASWFERLAVVDKISEPVIAPTMRPLDDSTGRLIDSRTGEVIGPRPMVTATMRMLNDGSGRMVDTETGELIALQPDQELRTGRAVVLRRLVISGGKVAIECGRISNPDMTNVEAAMLLGHLLDEAAAVADSQWDDLDDAEGPWNVVTVFTRKSRQRLRQKVAEADWWTPLQREDARVGMLTLTYPGEWELWAPEPGRHHRSPQRLGEADGSGARVRTVVLLGAGMAGPMGAALPPGGRVPGTGRWPPAGGMAVAELVASRRLQRRRPLQGRHPGGLGTGPTPPRTRTGWRPTSRRTPPRTATRNTSTSHPPAGPTTTALWAGTGVTATSSSCAPRCASRTASTSR